MVMLSLCGIVVSLQQTLLLPLLAELPRLLGTTVDNASWLVTATLLSGAIATPTISRLADMYGKRRMVLLSLAISVVGSLLGALSDALPLLIAARALQGAGIALVPVGIAIMRDELPRDRVPFGVALMSGTLAIGAGTGLPLSGVLSHHFDWRACFWLTGVVGVLLVIGTRAIVPESRVWTGGAFDVRGAVLLTISLSAVLLALTKGGQWGWTSPETLALAIGGLAMLALWVPLELRTSRPLIDLRVASRRAVLTVNVASVFGGFAMYANMLISVLVLQMPEETGYGLGLDIVDAGLWMMPSAAAFGLMTPVSAALTRRAGPQVCLIVGGAMMAVIYVGRIYYSDNLSQVVPGLVVVSMGSALVYSALPTLIMRAVPITETASANGLNVLLRSLGTSTASAATAAITSVAVTTVGRQTFPSLDGLNAITWLAACASAATAAVAIPMLRMQEYAQEAERSGVEHIGREAQVVKGRVVTSLGRPLRGAVVTVLTPDGDAIDWGQADMDGCFTVAIPDAGDYLVVSSAEGWRPRSCILHLDNSAPTPVIALCDQLTLTGAIIRTDGEPAVDALVAVTRLSGEVVGCLRTDHEGRYEMPRPSNGRYVITAAAREGQTAARAVTVLDTSRDVDLTLETR